MLSQESPAKKADGSGGCLIQCRSAAQDCNEDILREVLAYISNKDAARVALVCKSWLFPARLRLYNTVLIDLDRAHRGTLSSLKVSPHLTAIIRTLHLFAKDNIAKVDSDVFVYLKSPDLQGLRQLVLHNESTDCTTERLIALGSSMHFSKNLLRIQLRGHFLVDNKIAGLLNTFPNVNTLTMTTKAGEYVWRDPLRSMITAHLTRLSIVASVYTVGMAELFVGVSATLERFDLNIFKVRTDKRNTMMPELSSALRLHGAHLRHFTIEIIQVDVADAVVGRVKPFLDDIPEYLHELAYLRCSNLSFSNVLFRRLPVALHTLEIDFPFDLGPPREFPLKEIVDMLEGSSRPASLALLAIQSYRTLPEAAMRQLNEACLKAGVQFVWHTSVQFEDTIDP